MQLYTALKIFHYTDFLKTLPKENSSISAPLHIRIKPTNTCNHKCSYCAYLNEDLQIGKNMSVKDRIPREKMLEIVDDCIEMGVKAVTFSGGGEPFSYPHLAETARRLALGGISIASLTNGALLKGEAAEVFAEMGTWVRISMDGWDGRSYAEFRNVPEDEFSKVLKNIEDFQNLQGKCYLGVNFVVNHKNSDHVFSMARRLKDAGVNSLKISPCIVADDGKDNNTYHSPIFDKVKGLAKRAIDELSDDSFEIYDSYHSLSETFEKDYDWCPYLQINPVIAADQRIYSCHDKAYNVASGVLGSIKEQSFKECWENGKDKFFRIKPKCDCNHFCMKNNENMMIHDFYDADPNHLPFV